METEQKKRVRRPVLQVLASKARAITARLAKMGEPATVEATNISSALLAEINSLVDCGFVPPVKKREIIAFEVGKPVMFREKAHKNATAIYTELELNTMKMTSLDEIDGDTVVTCKTDDRNVLARLRDLETRA